MCFCKFIEPLLDIFYQQITQLARVAQQCYQIDVIYLHMNSQLSALRMVCTVPVFNAPEHEP